jgi:DNA-binding MarR family transcriptional regulator
VNHEDARQLLARVGVLRHRSDLDLLIFFARHPRALLTSEQLAAFLGHELAQIADSLESLLAAGLVTRTQNRNHAARLYVFAVHDGSGEWLPSLLRLASTRHGRLALLDELAKQEGNGAKDSAARRPTQRSGVRRPFLVGRTLQSSKTQAG